VAHQFPDPSQGSSAEALLQKRRKKEKVWWESACDYFCPTVVPLMQRRPGDICLKIHRREVVTVLTSWL